MVQKHMVAKLKVLKLPLNSYSSSIKLERGKDVNLGDNPFVTFWQ
jgi:hypothetical protein